MPRSWSAVLVLALVPALMGGCSSGEPAPSATPAVTAASSAENDLPAEDTQGLTACSALQAAVDDATLMTPGVVDAIVQAGATADAPITDAAQRLAVAYAAATAALGREGEPDAVAAVSVAGADMSGVCHDSGLDSVG